MAVLVEAISVIVRREAIDGSLNGGWDAFLRLVPNETLCADDEIARVGFMAPADVKAFIDTLEALGLRYLVDGRSQSIAVVDQLHGIRGACDWLQFGHVSIGPNRDQRAAACRHVGSQANQIVTPDGWTFERNLSSKFVFVPTDQLSKSMRFLRRENGIDVYFNELTGEEVYMGRSGER